MQFDYVIIGAGSTGCAGLERMSEDLAVTTAVGKAGDNPKRAVA